MPGWGFPGSLQPQNKCLSPPSGEQKHSSRSCAQGPAAAAKTSRAELPAPPGNPWFFNPFRSELFLQRNLTKVPSWEHFSLPFPKLRGPAGPRGAPLASWEVSSLYMLGAMAGTGTVSDS